VHASGLAWASPVDQRAIGADGGIIGDGVGPWQQQPTNVPDRGYELMMTGWGREARARDSKEQSRAKTQRRKGKKTTDNASYA
jgi:hypothetical protein